MSYRKVSYLEQIYYIIRAVIRRKINGIKVHHHSGHRDSEG